MNLCFWFLSTSIYFFHFCSTTMASFNNPMFTHSPLKRLYHISFDNDAYDTELPKKRFISEDTFAKELAAMSLDPKLPTYTERNKYSVRIEDMDDFLEDEQDDSDISNDMVEIDKTTLVESVINGSVLPMELRPGEHKLRIPDFVLHDSELTDPRDIMAYQKLLKSSNGTQKYIEVLNQPSTYYEPSAMDID
ncbi:hypothetical protein BDB01DRAFT_771650 [Pilobolus umbonatus]|nr:hypothetical protein BDB01DRAFT_771650 [Pilobolus umbonatus]